MNYFEHHIGDYDQATAHLSACEDGIYSRLIRLYMAGEKPLPNDIPWLTRRVRAHSRDEKKAVAAMLAEFFELREDGYHQKRCDEEIERYQTKQAKARASADARWSAQRQQCERNANASPEHDQSADATSMRTHSERNANGMHRAPVPRHQTPDTTTDAKHPSLASPVGERRPSRKCPPGFELSDELREWAKENAPGVSPDLETEKFRDHTFATARSDWPGTWRNWMRKAAENGRAPSRGAVVAQIGRQKAIEDHNQAVGDQWLREQEAMDASR